MNIIKKRTPKFLSATCLSFALVLGVPTPAGGEPLSYDLATVPRFAQKEKEPFVDTLGQLQELHQTKETIQSIIEDIKINYNEYLLPGTDNLLNNYLEDINSMIDEETLQKIYNDCNIIYEQIKKSKEIDDIKKREAELAVIGSNIQNAAYNTNYCVRNMCAAYVSYVFQNAGYNYIGGNANDMYWQYCNLSDRNAIRTGMIIAVASHDLTGMGRRFGHVGVVVKDANGNFLVRDNVGCLRDVPIDQWIEDYNGIMEVRWGWAIPV